MLVLIMHLAQIYNRVMTLDSSQNFISFIFFYIHFDIDKILVGIVKMSKMCKFNNKSYGP